VCRTSLSKQPHTIKEFECGNEVQYRQRNGDCFKIRYNNRKQDSQISCTIDPGCLKHFRVNLGHARIVENESEANRTPTADKCYDKKRCSRLPDPSLCEKTQTKTLKNVIKCAICLPDLNMRWCESCWCDYDRDDVDDLVNLRQEDSSMHRRS